MNLESDRGCSVADRVEKAENETILKWNWRRPLLGGRQSGQAEEIAAICAQYGFEGGEDSWSWRLEKNGYFTVASLKRAIDDRYPKP